MAFSFEISGLIQVYTAIYCHWVAPLQQLSTEEPFQLCICITLTWVFSWTKFVPLSMVRCFLVGSKSTLMCHLLRYIWQHLEQEHWPILQDNGHCSLILLGKITFTFRDSNSRLFFVCSFETSQSYHLQEGHPSLQFNPLAHSHHICFNRNLSLESWISVSTTQQQGALPSS